MDSVAKYRFVCSCGFKVEDTDRQKVLEAAKAHAKTCPHLIGADDVAIDAMIENIE
ncbi:MAG: hypothetical protein ACP5MC_02755 [Candidatus Micrarchaeia archaeon]